MTVSKNNPKLINSASITLSIIASGPCIIDKMIWASLAMATGSIHFTDLTGDHVMDLVVSDVAQQNIIEQATVFPQGLMFASLSGALSDSSASLSVSLSPSDVSSTSSTAMEIGKLFVWVR